MRFRSALAFLVQRGWKRLQRSDPFALFACNLAIPAQSRISVLTVIRQRVRRSQNTNKRGLKECGRPATICPQISPPARERLGYTTYLKLWPKNSGRRHSSLYLSSPNAHIQGCNLCNLGPLKFWCCDSSSTIDAAARIKARLGFWERTSSKTAEGLVRGIAIDLAGIFEIASDQHQ